MNFEPQDADTDPAHSPVSPSEHSAEISSETSFEQSPEAISEPSAPSGEASASLPVSAPTMNVRRDGLIAIGTAIGYLLLFRFTQMLPFSQTTVVTATLLSLTLVLLFTVTAARSMRFQRTLTINTLAAAVFALPYVLVPILATKFPTWHGWVRVGSAFQSYTEAFSHIPGLHGLLLMWFAVCIGVWLSLLVKEMKILLPMAVVLACMDLFVVFGGGLVTQANTGKAPVAAVAMQALTVRLPTTHAKRGAAPMDLSVGFADFLFIALFFACFARFGVPSRKTFITLCVVLVLYLAVVYIRGVDLPALVPIAVVVIGMNLRAFRYERSEAFALLYAGLIVAAALGALVFFSHR